jgi:hypothetical protein
MQSSRSLAQPLGLQVGLSSGGAQVAAQVAADCRQVLRSADPRLRQSCMQAVRPPERGVALHSSRHTNLLARATSTQLTRSPEQFVHGSFARAVLGTPAAIVIASSHNQPGMRRISNLLGRA